MLYLISFLAGILTILAPCALPMIPVICGRGIDAGSWKRIAVIISSFVISIVAFTLLLKISSACAGIDSQVRKMISAGILIVFGLLMLFPHVRDRIVVKTKISQSGILLSKSQRFGGMAGDILLGASLGPVFSSCSPTYALIVAVVLPASFASGFVAIVMYALGIASMLLLVIWGGRGLIKRLQFAADSEGWIKKILGLLIVLTGVFILTGTDKIIEKKLIDLTGTSLVQWEGRLVQRIQ